ncbi:DUF1904 family protein [Bacillus massiliigorillae]|uniref:DUF1904 family protein n=1 Tax=Bacillus massiliigorillae TaxID=1243664 RepID=UPI00039DF960|nr:DUF1904 family protein [Bacillus massiliigorillae]
MPQIMIRGISVDQVKQISQPLVEELAEICSCGTDNFTLEIPQATYICNGDEIAMYPFIEVKWFERGQEIRDQFAQAITKQVLSLGLEEIEVAFLTYEEDAYYINGESCAE